MRLIYEYVARVQGAETGGLGGDASGTQEDEPVVVLQGIKPPLHVSHELYTNIHTYAHRVVVVVQGIKPLLHVSHEL